MIIPKGLAQSAIPLETDGVLSPRQAEITNVSVVPFVTVELVEEVSELFTVPDGEYYRVAALSYYGRSNGELTVYCRPPGVGNAGATILYRADLTAESEAKAETVEGHVFGPGEALSVQTSGASATANVKLSVERITGTV